MKIRASGTFDGYSIRRDGIVTFKLRFPFSELSSAVKTVLALGKTLNVGIKIEPDAKYAIGECAIRWINIDRDGEVKITFETDLSVSKFDFEMTKGMIGKMIKVVMEV